MRHFAISVFIAATTMSIHPAAMGSWTAEIETDEMSGKIESRVVTNSENEVSLGWPYGTVSGSLVVRKHPRFGKDVVFIAEKGQIPCHRFSPCTILVRFDEKPPQKFSGIGPSDGSSNIVFISDKERFIAGLKTAKKMKIQAEFYQKGLQTFNFETEGINLESVIGKTKGSDRGEQKTASSTAPTTSTEALAKTKNCFACHDINKKIVGPAYTDVAKRYAGRDDAAGVLTTRIKHGGSGQWGLVPMPPNLSLSDSQARALSEWILTLN